jgi:DNA-binding protein HU-beta
MDVIRLPQEPSLRLRSEISNKIHSRKGFQEMATKAEMIEAVADAAGMSKADTEKTLGAFFDHVTSEMKKGESVTWPGFGKFSTSARAARTGRNPQTGEPVQIAASTAAKFSASSALKDALNGKK